MATLTPEQKTLLASIVNDKFSVGAFSGMIFNALQGYHHQAGETAFQEQWDEKLNSAVRAALDVRLHLVELAK